MRVRKVKTLDHLARRRLIEQPITFNIYGPCGGSGVTFHIDVPTAGHRVRRLRESADTDEQAPRERFPLEYSVGVV